MRRVLITLAVSIGVGLAVRHWLSQQPFANDVTAPSVAEQPLGRAGPPPPTPPSASTQHADMATEAPPPDAEARRTPSLSATTNVLLIGLDRRPGQKRGGRPDTLVVAALDEASGHVGLVSVPRDLYVDIPGHGFDRINATFAAAWHQKTSPRKLIARVIQDTLALPIAHTIMIDLGGFEQAIDALGGVRVHVPCPIADNFVDPRMANQRRTLDVASGMQLLDGPTAAMYVRSRHGRSDFSRARRQQAVLFGLRDQLLSVNGLTRLPQFLDKLEALVVTDMTRAELLQLASQLHQVGREQVHGLLLDTQQVEPWRTPDGKEVLLPKTKEISLALRQLFQAPVPGTRPSNTPCTAKNIALSHVSKPPAATASTNPEVAQGGDTDLPEQAVAPQSQALAQTPASGDRGRNVPTDGEGGEVQATSDGTSPQAVKADEADHHLANRGL